MHAASLRLLTDGFLSTIHFSELWGYLWLLLIVNDDGGV